MSNNRKQLREEAYAKLRASQNGAIAATFANDNPVVIETVEYVTANLKGASSIHNLTKASASESVGVQTFDSNKLDTGEHMVIDSVKGEMAIETIDAKSAGNASYNKTAPSELLSADIVIKQANELLRFPISEIHKSNPTATNSNEDKYRFVGHAPIIEAAKVLAIWVEFPEGVTMPEDKDYFFRFSFRGNKLQK